MTPTLPEHISHSQLSTWLECGKRYYFEKVSRLPQTPAWWFVGGSALHSASEWVCENYELHGASFFDQQATLVAKAREALDTELADRLTTTDVPIDQWSAASVPKEERDQWPHGQNYDWWFENIPLMLQRWLDFRISTDWKLAYYEDDEFGLTPAIELGLTVPFSPNTPPVQMHIDRVFVKPDGTYIPVDLKAGKTKIQSPLQLGIYRAGIQQELGWPAATGVNWYARDGRLGWEFGLHQYTPAYVGRLAEQFWLAVSNSVFLPNTSYNCKRCPFADHCIAWGGEKAYGFDPDVEVFQTREEAA